MTDATRRGFLGLVSAGATALLPVRQALAAPDKTPPPPESTKPAS